MLEKIRNEIIYETLKNEIRDTERLQKTYDKIVAIMLVYIDVNATE